MTRLFDAIAIVAAILAIWLGLYAYAGDAAITPPLRTFAFAVELFSRASFWNHVGATMAAFAMALAISAIGRRSAWSSCLECAASRETWRNQSSARFTPFRK